MRRSPLIGGCLVVALGFPWLALAQFGTAYTYQIVQYPTPANPTNPCVGAYGVNDLGQVVGYECSSPTAVPFIWENGVFTNLPPNPFAGPRGTLPLSISNSGQIVGYFFDAAGARHGFLYTPNGSPSYVQIDHPPPAAANGGPYDTLMVGTSLTNGTSQGIPGAYLLPSGAFFGSIYAAGRQVIDTEGPDLWQDFDGATDPVNGSLNSILAPGGHTSIATGINSTGVVAGRRLGPSQDSFIYIGGTNIPGVCPLAPSTAPPGCTPRFTAFSYTSNATSYPTHAWAINDNADVVGWFNDLSNGGVGQSFVRYGASGAFQVINVTDPVTQLPYISTALGINNRGVVVGDAYTLATWNSPPNSGDGAAFFVASPAVATTGVQASSCSASSGGCQLSPAMHVSVAGAANLPGTVTQQTCIVNPDPRVDPITHACSGQPLSLAQICPGFPNVTIPGYLCGGAGPTSSGFLVALNSAPGIDSISGITVNSELFAQQALGGPSGSCPATVAAWTPNPNSSVEGSIPGGRVLLDLTSGCGSSRITTRGLSVFGVGLMLNTAALSGTTKTEKLQKFAESKYDELQQTIAEGNMTLGERVWVSRCVSKSESFLHAGKGACAARRIVQCDAHVAKHADDFRSSEKNPNVFGDIRGRLGNLYLTIDARLLGNPAATSWPVPPSSAPSCADDSGEDD